MATVKLFHVKRPVWCFILSDRALRSSWIIIYCHEIFSAATVRSIGRQTEVNKTTKQLQNKTQHQQHNTDIMLLQPFSK